MARPGKEIRVTGIVTPAGWDKEDRVVQVLIAAPDENEFLINPDKMGKKLLDCLHEKVQVKGHFVVDDKEGIMIAVKSFESISSDAVFRTAEKPERRKSNAES